MTADGPTVNVLYGTVTGNAEEIARRIHAELAEQNVVQGLLRCLANFSDVPAFMKPSEHSANTFNVIVVSTTGDGDAPDTIRPFMRLLRSKDKSRLAGCNFTVLGLGDTNYENFCKTGQKVDTAMAKLGATRFMSRGEADDGVGLELVVEPWLEKLSTALETISTSYLKSQAQAEACSESPMESSMESSMESPVKSAVQRETDVNLSKADIEHIVKRVTAQQLGFDEASLPKIPVSKFIVEMAHSPSANCGTDDVLSIHPSYVPSVAFAASLKNARLLTEEDADKVVWHVELSCDESIGSRSNGKSMSYRPGDAFGLVVENDSREVSRFLTAAHCDANESVRVVDQNGNAIITASVERIVRERLDIRTIPSKTLLRVLSDHTENEEERRQLLKLCSRGGRAEYSERISKKNTSIVQLLETFAPSCHAPFGVYVDFLPAIPPRWYSATSSAMLDGENVVHFAFSVVENGLATNALARRCESFLAGESSSNIILLPRESDVDSHFHPPESLQCDYIMIGPGTGVAPFRGFLRERQKRLDEEDGPKMAVGKTMLFFGCRHERKDYLYRDELQGLVKENVLSELSVAFSRDGDEKVYVQDRLLERGEDVAEIMRNGGRIFVCGDGGGMAMGVHQALTDIATRLICDGDKSRGKEMMTRIGDEHRYVRDIWYFG